MSDLKACKQSNIPVYSFVTHQREDEPKYLYGAAIIIAEGIMALQDPGLRDLYDLKVLLALFFFFPSNSNPGQLFVQCDSDLMLARRLKRDVEERGRSVTGILEQCVVFASICSPYNHFISRYLRYVKPAYDNYVLPSQRYADIVGSNLSLIRPAFTHVQIVPGSNNTVAIDLICTHIRGKLLERSNFFRRKMAIPHLYTSPSGHSLPESKLEDLNLTILPPTRQLEVLCFCPSIFVWHNPRYRGYSPYCGRKLAACRISFSSWIDWQLS